VLLTINIAINCYLIGFIKQIFTSQAEKWAEKEESRQAEKHRVKI
jgi:hypothetical protein